MLTAARWSLIRHARPPSVLLQRCIPLPPPKTLYNRSLRPLTIDASQGGVEFYGETEDSSVTLARQRLQPPEDVFEDFSTEYIKQASTLPSGGGSSQSSEGAVQLVLDRLILKGDFEGARAAKAELSNAGVEFRTSTVYVRAARHSLERRTDPIHAKLLLEWWSLVPEDNMRTHLLPFSSALMQQPVQIDLVTEFFTLCAKAGLSNDIGEILLPFIFRYSNVESTMRFIQYFLDQAQGENMFSRQILLNLAMYWNYVAERRAEGFWFLEQIRKEGLQVEDVRKYAISRNQIDAAERQFLPPRFVLPKVPSGRIKTTPSPSTMGKYLRLLRRGIKSMYCENLATFAAFFIVAYEDRYGRTRAVKMLRERALRLGNLSVKSAWVAAEQLAYSRRKLPLPVIRSFLHYCLPSHTPVALFRALLVHAENRLAGTSKGRRFDKEDAESNLIPTETKFWPNAASLSAVWKAAIQLASTREDLDRLYSAMVLPLEKYRGLTEEDRAESLGLPMVNSLPVAELPDPVVFHHFIIAFSTRFGGHAGASVLADMSQLEVKQSMENWTVLAGVYARSGDVERVNDIITFLEFSFRGSEHSKTVDEVTFKSNMVVAYNSVIRGYTDCTMYDEARRIQQRMERLGYFTDGVPKKTRSILQRLSKSQRGKFDGVSVRNHRSWNVDGQKLRIDHRRVNWIP
ncbi:hypothetical protein SCHPADRAFT_70006 [Schizopora paradoxa]|uniref:Uncharacterized protein n=1 Tax=Schizopora paradoxa TaxID=27342 RepID=A0A0H2S4Z1_9AGAM|nr:hypothetical protein SCHPADRAFT_70006 [Schizopora paradoxa]